MPGRSRYLFGGEFRHSFSFHSQSVQTVYQLVFRFEPTSAKIDFPGGSDGEASVYNVGDLGSIPGSGSSLEKEMATHSRILVWQIPWTEEPGYSPWGRTELNTIEATSLHYNTVH